MSGTMAFDFPIPGHNPLYPDPEIPTPIDLVVRLTRDERERRVEQLVDLARMRYDEAIATHGASKEIVGTCLLVSGGNDSYTVASLFRDVATHIFHANTGTGIEATREHVRATAAAWGLPLIEKHSEPGKGYREMVLGQLMARSRVTGESVQTWPGGFPGPAAHKICVQRLKNRAMEQVPHHFGISGSRTQRVVFIAGRRRAESERRANVPHHETKGTIIWCSPIAVWHKADLRVFRLMHGSVPVNPVAQRLGMSGECGCLANARPGERERWFREFPDDPFIREIQELETLIRDREDIPWWRKKWGWGGEYDDRDMVDREFRSPVCGPDCGPDPLLDLMDPLFDLDGAA